MAWNAASQQWERVPAAVDLPSYRVTAQVDRFTEYAVVPLDAPAGTPLPTVSMAAPGMGVYEHDQKALVEVRLSQPMGQVAQVDYSTATVPGNGGLIVGATPGVDYTAVSGRLIFLPGEVSKTITVPIRDPEIADAEPGERFAVVLSNPSGIALGSQSRNEITIGANDGLSWGTLQTAGDEGTTIALTVRLNGPSNASVQVAYATRIGTATQPDFGARAGTLTFAPGETVKTISFKLAADPWDEPDETFWVDLSVPVNAQITGTASAKVIIRAIPTLPSLMEK
jgi:chitinase